MSMPNFVAALRAFANDLDKKGFDLDTEEWRHKTLPELRRTLDLDQVPATVIDAYSSMVTVILERIDEADAFEPLAEPNARGDRRVTRRRDRFVVEVWDHGVAGVKSPDGKLCWCYYSDHPTEDEAVAEMMRLTFHDADA
jgi:hypothetical protein